MSDHVQSSVPESTTGALDPRLWEVVRSMNLPQEILRDLHGFPEQAGYALLDTVEHLEFVDRPDLAEDLLEMVRAYPPTKEIGEHATHSLIEQHRSRGNMSEADALVEELLDSGPEPGPAHLLAEQLEEKGRLEEALRCYDIAAGEGLDLTATDLAGPIAYRMMKPLMGRTKVRVLLGLPPDEHDRAILSIMRAIDEGGDVRDFIDFDGGLLARAEERRAMLQKTSHIEVGFPRIALERARELGMVSPETSEDDHCRNTEHALRTTAREQPGTQLFVVLADADQVAGFAERQGLDSTARATAHTWAKEVASCGSSRLLPWPPERNKPCWYGSERKYKKCCGSPSAR